MPSAELRAEFPVLERVAYLNAGTDGPIPRRATEAVADRMRFELERGRAGGEHRASLDGMVAELRRELAGLLGCEASEVALTHSTTDGLNAILAGLGLRSGDEVLTSDEEHPGLLAPLANLRRRAGIELRTAPFAEIAGEVRASTRLVACSHVSWVSGRVVDTDALAVAGAPVLLDGAQGLGALPVEVGALGCDYYAGAGQKWLCGPDGSGSLFVRAERSEGVAPTSPGYESLAEPGRPLDLVLHPGARRLDRGAGSGVLAAWSLASLRTLADHGWERVLARGPELAGRLSEALAGRGVEVTPRGHSTLVSWRDPEPERAVERLAGEGFMVRDLPGRGLVRASVGAWSSDEEIDGLAALAR